MDYDNKSNGMHKRRYIKKNKNNKKKEPYSNHRSFVWYISKGKNKYLLILN